MPATRKLNISVPREAITVTRAGVAQPTLCYIITANRLITYGTGKSRIVYIGTTSRGIERLASTIGEKAVEILGKHGITTFQVHVVFCKEVTGFKAWLKLERALLLGFKELFDGEVPMLNRHGTAMVEEDEFTHFSRARVADVLRYLP